MLATTKIYSESPAELRPSTKRMFFFYNTAKTFRCWRITGFLCSSVRRMKDKDRNYFWQLSCSVLFYCFFKRPFLRRCRCSFFLLVDIKTDSVAETEKKFWCRIPMESFWWGNETIFTRKSLLFSIFFKSWGSLTFLFNCLY